MKIISSSDTMEIKIPLSHGKEIAPGLWDIPQYPAAIISVVFDFTEEQPDYQADNAWWHVDKNKVVHIQFQDKNRERYITLMDKQRANENLTKDENSDLEPLTVLLDVLPRAASEKAIQQYGNMLYQKIKKTENDDGEKEKGSAKQVISLHKPQREYFNTSKLVSTLTTTTGLIKDDTSLKLKTLPKRNIFTTIDFKNDPHLSLTNPNVTAYDMDLIDAAVTLMINGYWTFTKEMLVRVKDANFDPNKKISAQKLGAATKSLEKTRYIGLRINCQEELLARHVISKADIARNPDIGVFEGYLMPIETLPVRSGNKRVILDGIQLLKEPIIYSYSRSIKQIASVPTELLETQAITGMSDTDELVSIKRYLIKRIEGMRNTKNNLLARRIRLEWHDPRTDTDKGLLHDLGYDKTQHVKWRTKKSQINATVTGLLTAFQTAHYIKGYTVVKEGQTVVGYDIAL